MNEFDNTPIVPSLPQPTGLAGWFAVWIKSVTQPKEQTFIDIAEHPDARARTAYIWMFFAGVLSALVNGLVQVLAVTNALGNRDMFGEPIPIRRVVIGIFCAAPLAGVVSVLLFALIIAFTQWVAKLFGGTGAYDKLAYAIAAISVPFTLASLVIVPLNFAPYLGGICAGLLGLGLFVYALALQIMAVKAVNHFGWGQAAASVLLPGIVILIACACVVIIALILLGPVIGNIFNNINQGVQFAP